MGESFYSKGLNFTCKQCSRCCRHDPGYVYLSQTDLTNLCNALQRTEKEFIAQFCRKVPYYDGSDVLCLQEKQNYDCIFWNEGCTVYSARPIQCSTYPFWTFLLENKNAWDSEAASCPGINSGTLLNEKEICVRMLMYKENRPLRLSDEIDAEDVE